MPNGSQANFSTTIHLGGAIDPSLAKALGVTAQELHKMQANIASINRVSSDLNQQLNSFAPGINRASREAVSFQGSLRRVGEIAAGISIGEGLIGGLRLAGDLVRGLTRDFVEFATKASEVSAQYELLKRGLGNILNNQGLANTVFETEFRTAVRSPFQAKDLVQTVKRLVAAGAPIGQAQSMTKQIGDLVAGVGGGQAEMERAALVFGKIQSSGYMSGQEGRELKDLGIPYAATLKKILGTDDLEKAQKKHLITEAVIQKMLDEMTGPHGMFFRSMDKFAETFRGVQTSVADVVQRFEAQFGDIENMWTKLFLGNVAGSDMWDKVTGFMDNLFEANKSIVRFVSSMPSKELLAGVQPVIDMLSGSFHKLFGPTGLGFFFDYNVGGTGGSFYEQSGYHLNASGQAMVKQLISGIGDMFQKIGVMAQQIADIASHLGPAMIGLQRMASFFGSIDNVIYGAAGQGLLKGIKGGGDLWNSLFGGEHKLQRQFIGGGTHQFGASRDYWPSDVPYFGTGGVFTEPTLGVIGDRPEALLPMSSTNTLDDLNDSISKLNDLLSAGTLAGGGGLGFGGMAGAARGIGGGSWLANTVYGPAVDYIDANGRVHGTPDSDSNRGIGHIHGVPYSLINGTSVAMHPGYATSHYHIKPGEWYKSDKDGKMHRWMDTSGASNPNNEDFYKSSQINMKVEYHISAIEAGDVHKFAKEHARTLSKHIENHLSLHKEARLLA
jgi:hypothetical protein